MITPLPVWLPSTAAEAASVNYLSPQVGIGVYESVGGRISGGGGAMRGMESEIVVPPPGHFRVITGAAAGIGSSPEVERLMKSFSWPYRKEEPYLNEDMAANLRLPSFSSLRVADLGWTRQQAAEIRARLESFAEDWNAPGMEGYDDL